MALAAATRAGKNAIAIQTITAIAIKIHHNRFMVPFSAFAGNAHMCCRTAAATRCPNGQGLPSPAGSHHRDA
jgi:hypothetical protein